MSGRKIALALGAAALLAGCATPQHTNLLVFGTNTVVGLKVGAEATQVPAIQLGYARQEAVLMPLLANTGKAGDGALTPCPIRTADDPRELPQNCKFVGVDGAGGLDSYSVLASFGARYGADQKDGHAGAHGAIAQYFATGLAARELARNAGAAAVASSEAAAASGAGAAYIAGRQNKFEIIGNHFAASGIGSDAASVTAAMQGLDQAAGSGTTFQSTCARMTKDACAAAIKAAGTIDLLTLTDAQLAAAANHQF